jgi:hypothetical protein
MRRLCAYFALLVIGASVLNPFLAAAQMSRVATCCRRSGMHHCQKYSGETGLHAPRAKCPFSAPVPLATFAGLESAEFSLSAPAIAGFVVPTNLDRTYHAVSYDRGARGPPLSLL